MISARAAGRTTIVSPVTTRVEVKREDIRGSSEWRFPCREPDEGRPSRPVRRAGISRPYYHYAFAMLLGSTLFVTFSRATLHFFLFFLFESHDQNESSFVLPSLNYLLNIEFARNKISTNWDHKADWANGKGGVSRSAIDYRQTFPELQPSLSIQDTTTCTTTTGICVQVMVRVEKQRGHAFPKLVRSPERRKLSCLAMAEERDIIANREERKSNLPLSPYRCLTLFCSPGLSSPPFPRLPSEKRRGFRRMEFEFLS
ncbi:hypothetical protein VNO77_46300 [Canavalia gladiata]|uniref:Uncharacterized protein n=1 Tax=Canavalia gladiata TaxID=3824 RepID=A0AAN9JH12_CANGL